MFSMNNRAINENNKIKNSILKNLINYIKYHRVVNKSDVIKLEYLSKIMIFKSDISIMSAFLSFYYDKYVC